MAAPVLWSSSLIIEQSALLEDTILLKKRYSFITKHLPNYTSRDKKLEGLVCLFWILKTRTSIG